jgi:hypothetical protein
MIYGMVVDWCRHSLQLDRFHSAMPFVPAGGGRGSIEQGVVWFHRQMSFKHTKVFSPFYFLLDFYDGLWKNVLS